MIHPRKCKVRINVNDRAQCYSRCKLANEIDDGKVIDSKVKDNKFGKNNQKIFKFKNLTKSKKLFKFKKIIGSLNFFIPKARLVFIKLGQAFVKPLIFYHFESERHI